MVAVLGDRLIRDVADRRQIVCRRHRQDERFAGGAAAPSVTVTVIVAVPTGSPPESPSPSDSRRCPRAQCWHWEPGLCSRTAGHHQVRRRRLTSPTVNARARGRVFVDRLIRDVGEIVGGSLTGHRQQERVSRRAAVRVRHRDRDRRRPGLVGRRRHGHRAIRPVPPNTMFAFGTRAVFDDCPSPSGSPPPSPRRPR